MWYKSPMQFTAICLVTGLQASGPGALAQHTVSLEVPNTVPSYCQEAGNWCGAATGQMALEGYPGGVEHPFTQTQVWNTIVTYRDDPGANWATDPDGMRDMLMDLGGDPGVHWSIFSDPTAATVMHDITFWMTIREYPTPVLVDPGGSPYGSFQHWVLIEGFVTDVDPTANPAATLQFIDIVDPWNPPCPANTSGGIRQTVSGATWYTTYWGSPGNYPASKWHGNYVAVVEPPEKEGVVRAQLQVQEGEVISRDEARERAMKYMEELRFRERPAYAVLKDTVALEPLLINPRQGGYYLVPFGYEEGQLSQGAILVNAYSGDFEEIGAFERPFAYLDQRRALRLAGSYLCDCEADEKRLRDARADLVFQASAQARSRFLPVWRVSLRDETVFVTQEGLVFEAFVPMQPGD